MSDYERDFGVPYDHDEWKDVDHGPYHGPYYDENGNYSR